MVWKVWQVSLTAIASAIGAIFLWDLTTPSLASDPKQECHAIAGYLVWRRVPVVDPIADPRSATHSGGEPAGTETLDCSEVFRGAGISTAIEECDPNWCDSAGFSRVRPIPGEVRQVELYVDRDCPGIECGYGVKVRLKRYARIWFIISEDETYIL